MKILISIASLFFTGLIIQSCSSTKQVSNSGLSLTADTTIVYGKIRYSGGNGSSKANAIKIHNAKNARDGIPAEYYYIKKVEKKYSMISQALIMDSLVYDKLTIRVKGGKKEYWFDITDFFGKF